MMFSAVRLVVPVVLALSVEAATAEVPDRIAPLITAMGMDQILEIMSEEGHDYGDTIESDLFPDQGGAGWEMDLGRIYDPDTMATVMGEEMSDTMDDTALADAIEFFTSGTGTRIVELEIGARRALLDPEVEEAAEAAAAAAAEKTAKYYFSYVRSSGLP